MATEADLRSADSPSDAASIPVASPAPPSTAAGATTTTTSNSNSTAANLPKAVIKNVDMSDEMQQMVVDLAQSAMQKFTVEKDIAAHIKREMDKQSGPTWHTVVGANFGSYVTHETHHFIYFYLGKVAFLIWRA